MALFKEIVLFTYRLVYNLLKLLIVCIPLQLIGLILVPIALLMPTSSYHLPTYFKWFDCADWYIGRDTTTINAVRASGFWYSYYWLALRNPINYFGYCVLGYKVPLNTVNTYMSNTDVGDSAGKGPGFEYNELNEVYEYYYIHKWNDDHCLRFRMGHKLGIPFSNPVGSMIQWVFVIQPYKSYTGT